MSEIGPNERKNMKRNGLFFLLLLAGCVRALAADSETVAAKTEERLEQFTGVA
ncbi:MAG: hypothetical protein KJO31_13455 [Gammaproteobacteria bacterium]|nr:hypothetical protein [Gammaproteobacteria bacterium]